MKLNRNSLRKMILKEIRQLNEEAGGYDALSAEDKLYAQVGYIDQRIQSIKSVIRRSELQDKLLSDCQSIKAAVDAGKAAEWKPKGDPAKGSKGSAPVFASAVRGLQKKQSSEISDMVKRGKYMVDRTK